jgi:hypothetical protein
MAAREAAAIPFPREETTPPVTNTYFVILFSTEKKKRRASNEQAWLYKIQSIIAVGSLFVTSKRPLLTV